MLSLSSIRVAQTVLFPGSDKLPRRYSYREEKEHDRLTEMSEIIFYEMPKLEKKVKGILDGSMDIGRLSEEEKWCMYMKYRHDERAQTFIEELCRKEEEIMRAEQAVQGISRSYLKSIREMNIIKNSMDHAQRSYDAGRTEGRVVGLEEGKLEIARKLKNKGLPLAEIADITGLSFETIEQM